MLTKMLATVLLSLALGAGSVACAQEKPAAAPLPGPTVDSAEAPARPVASVVIASDVRAKCGMPTMDSTPKFGFDSAQLAIEGRQSLDALATCLKTGPLRGEHIQLIGRTDPRGSSEYNIALGAYRAQAVETYLHSLGVPSEQLGATSRGELDAKGSDENTWATDRRVDVTLRPSS